MSVKTYLWIEDRIGKASYIFWTVFMRELCPDVIVEGKMNNRELVKAVKGLNDKRTDTLLHWITLLIMYRFIWNKKF